MTRPEKIARLRISLKHIEPEIWRLVADSDDFGRGFRADVGHLFRLKSAGRSD